jgi:uncharacterized protein YuzE
MANHPFQVEIDPEADAAYVQVSNAPVVRTGEVADGIIVDFAADDAVVGVEVLGLQDRVGTRDSVSYLQGLVEGLQLRPSVQAAE